MTNFDNSYYVVPKSLYRTQIGVINKATPEESLAYKARYAGLAGVAGGALSGLGYLATGAKSNNLRNLALGLGAAGFATGIAGNQYLQRSQSGKLADKKLREISTRIGNPRVNMRTGIVRGADGTEYISRGTDVLHKPGRQGYLFSTMRNA